MSKFCEQCGWKMEDTDRFCMKCGADNGADEKDTAPKEDNEKQKPSLRAPGWLKNKKKLALIGIGIAGIAAAVGVIIFIGTRPKTFDLNSYLTYEFSGYEGDGMCAAWFDSAKIEQDIAPIIRKKMGADKNNVGDLGALLEAEEIISGLAEINVAPMEALSNGDEVKIAFSYDNDTLKKYGVKLQGDEQTVTVQGLPEKQQLDAFKDLKIKFSGVAPSATTDRVIRRTIDEIKVTYNCMPYENLEIGDKVTVTVDPDFIPEGYTVKEDSMEVEVKDVDSYILDGGELTKDELKKISDGCLAHLKKGDIINGTVYASSATEPGSPSKINSYYTTITNPTLNNAATLYADTDGFEMLEIEQGHTFGWGGENLQNPVNAVTLVFECDAAISNSGNSYNGQTLHCYGAMQIKNLIRKMDGSMTFEQNNFPATATIWGTADTSDLYTDKANLDEVIEEVYNNNYPELDAFSVTLDGSQKSELINEGTVTSVSD